MLRRVRVGSSRWGETLAWAALTVLLLLTLPLFLRMPLWADVTLYDLAARAVLRGGVHYRDVFDTNLPGMVWLHLAIRSLFGWRSESMRAVDLLIVGMVVALLVRWLRILGVSRGARVWTVVALCGFYLSTPEINHCQRDVWMLLPALGAAHLRVRQLAVLARPETPWYTLGSWAVIEGACWGIAFWIKPHVIVPAAVCWLVGVAWLCMRAGRPPDSVVGPSSGCQLGRVLVVDAGGLVAGGLFVGGVGILWLWSSGTWPYFWEVFLGWNPEYCAHTATMTRRPRDLFKCFRPWGRLHFAALPLALWGVCGFLTCARSGKPAGVAGRPLLAAFYLGWLLQALYVQKGHDYVLVPPLLLGLALVMGYAWSWGRYPITWVGLGSLALLLAVRHPLLQPPRLALWGRCWLPTSTAELRDQLKQIPDSCTVRWRDLDRVADYLRRLGLRDGELTCYNNFTHPLYLELDLQPSTPFLHFDTILTCFPGRRENVRHRLNAGCQRYVVSDLFAVNAHLPGGPRASASAGGPTDLGPEQAQLYPWSEPVLFRSGRYLVHRVTGPARQLVPATGTAKRGPKILD
jgi:hypothetical protein